MHVSDDEHKAVRSLQLCTAASQLVKSWVSNGQGGSTRFTSLERACISEPHYAATQHVRRPPLQWASMGFTLASLSVIYTA